MPSATIKVFLVHGDAKRLRTAELSNWTGKAVAGPRSELDSILARDESESPGVYFLSGTDSDSGKPAIYVGKPKEFGVGCEATQTRTSGITWSFSSVKTRMGIHLTQVARNGHYMLWSV